MKKLNRILSLSAAAALALALTACSGGPSGTADTPAGGSSNTPAAGETYKVAVIKQMDHASLDEIANAITARLDAIAQEQNVSIRYTITSGQGDQSVLKQLADQAVADQVDAIIPIATTAAQVSAVAAEDSRTPVVYAAISDPDTAKLTGIDYVTGTSDALNTEYILDMMLAQDPGVSKVGLLYSLSEPNSTKPIAEAKAYLEQHGITCVEQTANTNDEVVAAAAALISAKVDAVFTPTDNVIMAAELAIYEDFIAAGIPHYTGADSFALNGAFLGYGVDYANLGVETANMVSGILLDGSKPSATPVLTFDNGTATINTDICKELGLNYDELAETFAPLCTKVQSIVTAESFDDLNQ